MAQRDVAALTALCQDETIVRWTNVPASYTEDMACARLAEAETDRQAGRALVLAVVDGVAHIEIFAHPENLASIAVAERAGFTRESLLRGYRVKKGRREDRVVLSLTASGLWS